MAAYDAGPDDWMDAQPQAKAPADTGLNDWQDAPGAPQQQPVAKGLSQEIDDWQDPPRQGAPAASSAPSIPSTPSTPSAPPEPAFIPPNTYDEATIAKQGAAVQSKGVNPNGSVPGYKPTLDKANAGDKWTTISASQDGLNLTFVVPENPAFNDFIKQHQTEIDNEEIPNPYLEELKKTGKQYGVYESDAAAAKDMQAGQAKPSVLHQIATGMPSLANSSVVNKAAEAFNASPEPIFPSADERAALHQTIVGAAQKVGLSPTPENIGPLNAATGTIVDAFANVGAPLGVAAMNVMGRAIEATLAGAHEAAVQSFKALGWSDNDSKTAADDLAGALQEVTQRGEAPGVHGNARMGELGQAGRENAAGAFSGATAEALNKPLAIEDMRGRGPEEAAPPEAPRSPDGGVNDWADVATPTQTDRFGPQFGGIDDWQDAPQGAATHEPIPLPEAPSNELAKSNVPPEAPAEAAPPVQTAADYSEPIPAPAEAPSPPVNARGNRPAPPPPVNLREILNDKRSLEEIKAEREAAIKASEPAAGTREAPAPAGDMEAMDNARANVETMPSEAQKEAGNYQKGHVDIHGMDVTIETPKGAERQGPIDKTTGEPTWTNVHPEADYGYIKRTNGADGEQVDVYIGPNPSSSKAYVVDQYDPKTGKFDEHKSILGADSQEQAIAIYDRGFSDGSGPARRKGITEMPVRQFKQWAMKGDTTKPLVKVTQARQVKPLRADVESDLIHTIRAMGGIKLKDAKGDVTKEGQDVMAALKDFRRPGLINNKAGGLPPDQVLKTLREQRWFVDAPDQGADIQNLYDILGRAGQAEAGVKVHHPESEAARTQLQAKDEAADARGRSDIEALGKKAGFELSNSEIDAVIARMQEGVDAESAIHDHFERAAIADLDAGAEENPGEDYEVPFEGELAEAPSQAGEAVQRPQGEAANAAPGREISQGAEGVSPNPQETRQAPQVEAGAEGLPQSVIPGAERMSEQEVARRRKLEANQRGMAEMKLKQQQSKLRKSGQQSAGGMFEEGRNQTDLLSQPRKEPPLFKTPGVSPTPSKLNLDVVSGKAHADEVMQMELDAGKKKPFAEVVAEQKKTAVARDAKVTSIMERDGRVIGTYKDIPARRIVLTKGTEEAPYRVTSFHGDEPTGHRDYQQITGAANHLDNAASEFSPSVEIKEKRSASTSDDGGAMERAPGAVGRGTPQEVQAKKAPARQSESPSESVPSKQKPQITQSGQGPKTVDKTALSESVPSKPKPIAPTSGGRYETKRKFPSYTTAELKAAAADTEKNSPEQIARLKEEIAARESGASKPFKTPQIVQKKQEPKTAERSSEPIAIETGTLLKTKSGRVMSPAPHVEGGPRKTKTSLARIDGWLLAAAKVESRGNEHVSGLLAGMNPERLSSADRDLLNEILFGGREGPTAANLVEESAPKFQAPKRPAGKTYPIAPQGEWHGDANFEKTGGKLIWMSPDDFLEKARTLNIDETSRGNIDDLKRHIESGKTLDPLALYSTGKEDGRHRAVAAKELGIKKVPVLVWERPKFQARKAPTFFSALEKGIGAIKMEKAPPIQWRNTIKNLPGVKKEELDWSGIDQWLETQKGPVTKAQVIDQVRQNNVQIKEVENGIRPEVREERDRLLEKKEALHKEFEKLQDAGNTDYRDFDARLLAINTRLHEIAPSDMTIDGTKYRQYTLPGGENYRELLLTLPRVARDDVRPSEAAAAPFKAKWDELVEKIQDLRAKSDALRGGKGDFYQRKLGIDEQLDALQREQDALHAKIVDVEIARNPGKYGEPFKDPHFPEPNIVAHIRFDDRTGPNGEKVLHIAEIQSGWAQRGRREGFARKTTGPVDLGEFAGSRVEGAPQTTGVPDMPFKSTEAWAGLALKRMLRYASEHGYDRLSWDTGETQADRYDISKQVDSVLVRKQKDGTFSLAFVEKGQKDYTVTPGLFTEKELADQLGKDLAEKVTERAKTTEPGKAIEFSGLDLKLGNTGMQGFYDKILPDFLNKYARKWGAKVEQTTLPHTAESEGDFLISYRDQNGAERRASFSTRGDMDVFEGRNVNRFTDFKVLKGPQDATTHSISITDAMREFVMGGQPLFKSDVPFGRRVGALPPRVRGGVHSEPGRINISANISATPVANATAAQKALMDQIGALAKRIIPGTTARPMAKIEAQGMGLGEGMRPVEGVAYGTLGKRVIAWSLESADAAGTLRHEALHYLREYMSDEEWQTLVAAARRGNWLKKHQIDERYPGLNYEAKMEEAIAEEIGVWRRFKDSKIPEAVRGIFQRIAEFLAAVAKHVRKLFGAHATANDIFSDVMSGKMGREAKQAAAGSKGPKFQAARQPPGLTQPGLGLPSVAEPVGKKLTNLEDRLFRIRQNNEDDRTAIRQLFKKMPKAMFDPALQERMYQHAEENTTLVPEEQAMYDKWIKPLKKEENAVYNRIKDTGYPVSPDGYMHRIVQGKGSMYDEAQGSLSQNPTYGRIQRSQNKLNKTAPSMKERTVFMAEGDQGTLRILRGDDYKPGDTYRDNGENFTVRQATTREIEENTDLRYFKNALVNTADNVMRLRRAERSINFLDQLKQDPTFQENATAPGSTERIPPDWKTTRLPQLAGWKMNPRLANLFDDFYGHGETNLDMIVGRVNRAIVSSIFVNPVSSFFGHGANVAGHWFVSRGWSNFLPHTYAQSAANGMKAIKDVVTLSPNYRQLMRQGAALQLAPVLNRKFHETMIKAMQGDMNARPQNWQEIAKTAGTTPKAIYDALSHVSSAGLWGLNDVLLLQRIYDLQGRSDMSPKQAIREAERGIPNYRIPTEAWEGPGGRTFSELLQNGNLTLFGRYRYGILKAYAETIKDMGGKGKTPKQRIKGLGEALALVALVALIYPQADKAWRYATGNKEATARRAGPTTLPDALTSAATGGPKDFSAALGGLFGMSPAIQSAVELGSNRELFTGNRIYNPQGSALEIAKELGYYGATQFTPVEQAAQIARGRRQFYPETVGTMVGVKLPEPGEAQRLRRIRALEKRRESQRFRRIENSIKRGVGIQ